MWLRNLLQSLPRRQCTERKDYHDSVTQSLMSQASSDDEEIDPLRRKAVTNRHRKKSVLLHTTIIFTYSVIFVVLGVLNRFKPSQQSCVESLTSWSPATSAVQYGTTVFDAAFNASTVYRGTPSAKIDAAWDALTVQPAIALSKDEVVHKLGKDPSYAVRLPEDGVEVYAGFVEVFHQLHCVDMIRRYTYWEHYATSYPAFLDSPATLRHHLDHCIDVLRINLMCNSDVSIMTFHWLADKSWPDPDFETRHQCRNFDAIVDWVNQTPRARIDLPKKPTDAVIFDPQLAQYV